MGSCGLASSSSMELNPGKLPGKTEPGVNGGENLPGNGKTKGKREN